MDSSADSASTRPEDGGHGRDRSPGKLRRWLGRILLGIDVLDVLEIQRISAELGTVTERLDEANRTNAATDARVQAVERRLDTAEEGVRDVQREAERLVGEDGRVSRGEQRLDAAEDTLRLVQAEIEKLTGHDGRLAATERRVDAVEKTAEALQAGIQSFQGEIDRIRAVEVRLDTAEEGLRAAQEDHEALTGPDGRLVVSEQRLDMVAEAAQALQGSVESLQEEIQGICAVEARLDTTEESVRGLQHDHERLIAADGRVAESERRLDSAENMVRELQGELDRLRDTAVPRVEERIEDVAVAAAELTGALEELRDQRLPAAVNRGDALVDRLASKIEEVGSLVERVMLREPLPVTEAGTAETELAESLAEIQPALLDELRGSVEQITDRMRHYLHVLTDHQPVLDLGSGRGELLELLRDHGVEAEGIEIDPALAAASRRRGLKVTEGDALGSLSSLGDASFGAVTAVHLLEHLSTAALARVLAEVRRVLRPGGVLVAECPNVATLRVGGHEFWLDPTHVRPLPQGTLELFLRSSGLDPVEREHLRPFSETERLGAIAAKLPDDGSPEVREIVSAFREMCHRVDELLNGPRDLVVVARRFNEE